MQNMQEIPWAGPRLETGPVRVGDDRAGLFLRGDEALMYSAVLHHLLDGGTIRTTDRAVLESLARHLRSCLEGKAVRR